MATGVDVDIVDGQARIEFADKATKDKYLAKLLDAADDPRDISLDTGGTKRTYIVSEDVAVKAGLVSRRKAK